MKREIRQILLIRTDRMGDLLMNVPVIQRLRQNFSEAIITVVCAEQNIPLLRYHLDVNRLVGVRPGELRTLRGKIGLWRRLRRHRFDALVVSQPDKFFHVLGCLLGIPHRLGFGRKWGFLLTKAVADRKADSGRHEIDSNLELLDGLCPQRWDGRIDLGFDTRWAQHEMSGKFGLRRERRVVAFHMTTSNPVKEWPPEKFRQVIDLLLEKPRYQIVLVGREYPRGGESALRFDGCDGVVDLTGRTSLADLAVVLRNVHCLVSLDSGPYHLAWMQQVPVVGIFIRGASGSQPGRWGVYPGFVACRQIQKAAGQITPEEVFAAVEDVITEHRRNRIGA